ncbi:hypothetical protein, partial [Paracoccus sp. (in: a-proteobacteria)]
VGHNKVGDMLAATGDGAGALAAYREGMAISSALAARDPGNSVWQRDLIVSHVKLAERGGNAVEEYRAALAIAMKLSDADRLRPVDHWMVSELELRLQNARNENDKT